MKNDDKPAIPPANELGWKRMDAQIQGMYKRGNYCPAEAVINFKHAMLAYYGGWWKMFWALFVNCLWLKWIAKPKLTPLDS